MAQSRTFKRYLYRIFIPIAVVGLIAVVMRMAMVREFNQEHVRPTEPGTRVYPHRDDPGSESRLLPYSQENKERAVADLQASLAQLRASEQERAVEEAGAVAQARQLEDSITALESADAENWRERLDRAYRHLSEYARAAAN